MTRRREQLTEKAREALLSAQEQTHSEHYSQVKPAGVEVEFAVRLEALQQRCHGQGRKTMRYRNYRFFGPGFGFSFGFPPFGFHLRGRRGFLKREEYLQMLEEYKQGSRRNCGGSRPRSASGRRRAPSEPQQMTEIQGSWPTPGPAIPESRSLRGHEGGCRGDVQLILARTETPEVAPTAFPHSSLGPGGSLGDSSLVAARALTNSKQNGALHRLKRRVAIAPSGHWDASPKVVY